MSHSVKCLCVFFLLLIIQDHKFIVPSIFFAISVVVRESVFGVLRELCRSGHRRSVAVHLLWNGHRNRGRGAGSAVGGMSGRHRLSVVGMKSPDKGLRDNFFEISFY